MLSVEMMIVFLMMLAMALYFILPSLVLPQDKKLADVKASLDHRLSQLKQEYQLQNKELARRLKNGDLAEQEWQQLNDELQLETTTAIDSTLSSSQSSQVGQLKLFAASTAVVLMLVSYSLYFTGDSKGQAENQMQIKSQLINNPNAIKNIIDNAQTDAEATDVDDAIKSAKNLANWQQLYLALRTKLELQPSNIELWREFANFNVKVGRNKEAFASLKQAIKISPNNFDLKLELAQMYATAKSQPEQVKANKLLIELVNQDPKHQGARIILAFNAYNLNDYSTAINQWQYLLSQRKAGSSSAQMLQNSIDAARAKLNAKSQFESINNDNQVKDKETDNLIAQAASIDVEIGFSEILINQLSGNESLFVFAKAVDGPRFPVAVVKLPLNSVLQQNKVKLSLNDSHAMQAAFALSKFEQVVVSARISKTGNAIAQAGDVESTKIQLSAPFNQKLVTLSFD